MPVPPRSAAVSPTFPSSVEGFPAGASPRPVATDAALPPTAFPPQPLVCSGPGEGSDPAVAVCHLSPTHISVARSPVPVNRSALWVHQSQEFGGTSVCYSIRSNRAISASKSTRQPGSTPVGPFTARAGISPRMPATALSPVTSSPCLSGSLRALCSDAPSSVVPGRGSAAPPLVIASLTGAANNSTAPVVPRGSEAASPSQIGMNVQTLRSTLDHSCSLSASASCALSGRAASGTASPVPKVTASMALSAAGHAPLPGPMLPAANPSAPTQTTTASFDVPSFSCHSRAGSPLSTSPAAPSPSVGAESKKSSLFSAGPSAVVPPQRVLESPSFEWPGKLNLSVTVSPSTKAVSPAVAAVTGEDAALLQAVSESAGSSASYSADTPCVPLIDSPTQYDSGQAGSAGKTLGSGSVVNGGGCGTALKQPVSPKETVATLRPVDGFADKQEPLSAPLLRRTGQQSSQPYDARPRASSPPRHGRSCLPEFDTSSPSSSSSRATQSLEQRQPLSSSLAFGQPQSTVRLEGAMGSLGDPGWARENQMGQDVSVVQLLQQRGREGRLTLKSSYRFDDEIPGMGEEPTQRTCAEPHHTSCKSELRSDRLERSAHHGEASQREPGKNNGPKAVSAAMPNFGSSAFARGRSSSSVVACHSPLLPLSQCAVCGFPRESVAYHASEQQGRFTTEVTKQPADKPPLFCIASCLPHGPVSHFRSCLASLSSPVEGDPGRRSTTAEQAAPSLMLDQGRLPSEMKPATIPSSQVLPPREPDLASLLPLVEAALEPSERDRVFSNAGRPLFAEVCSEPCKWSRSTLRLRCALASSLRSVFKLLIKRVRESQKKAALSAGHHVAHAGLLGKAAMDKYRFLSKANRRTEKECWTASTRSDQPTSGQHWLHKGNIRPQPGASAVKGLGDRTDVNVASAAE
ncbi:hypothetical protein CSUI_010585, partial [Cystoisospora suis]